MFKITEGKGFHIIFKNGVNLSVQFGRFNYCDNKGITEEEQEDLITRDKMKSYDAEIGIWDKEDNWITDEIYKKIYKRKLKYGDVMSYIEPDEFAKIVYYCQKYKN